MSICAVSLSLLPPCSNLAKQALDFLNELEKNGLAEKDVDPRVKDGVEGCKAYCSEVRIFVQLQLHWSFIELVQKHLSL